jgi:molecular chaperone GrpE (heat shock protein)
MDAEFIIDEEPIACGESIEAGLVALLRQLSERRQELQENKLRVQDEIQRQREFLKQLLALKERKCDQFVTAGRARMRAASDAAAEVREETDKWLHRLEAFQQSFDVALLKFGVTRYEPSGLAMPERDDVKDTESRTGQKRGTILQILRPGYLWNGEVLRPAEVIVAD